MQLFNSHSHTPVPIANEMSQTEKKSPRYNTALPSVSYRVPVFEDITNSRIPGLVSEWHLLDEDGEHGCEILTLKSGKVVIGYRDQSDLYEDGTPSMVGVGTDTVLDTKLRQSVEFTEFKINAHVLDGIEEQVEYMINEMNAGKLISIKPHKFIMYRGPTDDNKQGDFFAPHIDSLHTGNQTMSCVAEFSSKFGGDGLIIDGTPNPSSGNFTLFVFDHDLKHEVAPVTSGLRLSITFDLVVEQAGTKFVCSESSARIKELVDDVLKPLGTKRIGWLSSHLYLGGQDPKGFDSMLLQALECVSDDHELVILETSDPDDSRLTDADLGVEHTDQSLMVGCDENDGVNSESIARRVKPLSEYTGPSPGHSMYAPEYCLGDVFVFATDGICKQTMRGMGDVHLGNEGFDGAIHQAVLFVVTLK